jgi:4'-phosphopantetheinyl transferase
MLIPAAPCLGDREVHCWHVRIPDVTAAHGTLAGLLGAEERCRGSRFRDARRRTAFEIGRGLTRALLQHYGAGPAATVPIRCSPSGKPEAVAGGAGRTVHFNVSHSGDVLLLAFARFGPVGVDVEVPRQLACDDLAAAVLSATELRRYLKTDAAARPRLLLAAWTRKEAVLKAMGTGIRGSLKRLTTCAEEGEAEAEAVAAGHVVSGQSRGYAYVAAVAHRLPRAPISACGLVTGGGAMRVIPIDAGGAFQRPRPNSLAAPSSSASAIPST